jgi:anti-sigma B factor antagonist
MTESKSNSLEITVGRSESTVTLTVRGEVDLETSAALREAFDGAIDSGDIQVDLSAVDYMDSTGLRAVLVARDEAESRGATLRVVAASNIVSRLIEIAGVDGLLA